MTQMASRAQCISYIPTTLQAVGDARAREANFPGPCGDTLSTPIVRQIATVAAVLHLLLVCSPSAVARFVVPVVVDTVEFETSRCFAHVGKEVLEGVPSFAHLDAPPSVVYKSRMSRVETSTTHCSPYLVGGSFRHSVGCLNPALVGCGFASQATTAASPPIAQIFTVHDNDSVAVTSTFPHCGCASIRNAFDCNETMESLTNEIVSFATGHVTHQHISGVV